MARAAAGLQQASDEDEGENDAGGTNREVNTEQKTRRSPPRRMVTRSQHAATRSQETGASDVVEE